MDVANQIFSAKLCGKCAIVRYFPMHFKSYKKVWHDMTEKSSRNYSFSFDGIA